MAPKVTVNAKAMRDLEKRLTAEVKVPSGGSESAAMADVKRQYEKQTGAKLNDAAARNLVRKGRK
ncbi:hypothetical protein HQO84_17555 [Rhodococcus fascians]|uniref:hypothetical protein n=1 Tax=Nocardiaceae TaxID=85025 RepID=UPI0019D1EF57|nr:MULTISPECIES: hypothetical protein [Rhodococcus]MBW4779485.1 hypothetical protein [Rhodococcus fascians]MBY3989065.1 hypothetical protein [Rhodococcus fascians]MBY3998680.1 hypothetical protein [Rhodococcus fascians]MBY4003426.1 hypothetical protein [Rhodococcus fascians]MBY4008176.1 hypothetical protein [Rhodococcus fascians]